MYNKLNDKYQIFMSINKLFSVCSNADLEIKCRCKSIFMLIFLTRLQAYFMY